MAILKDAIITTDSPKPSAGAPSGQLHNDRQCSKRGGWKGTYPGGCYRGKFGGLSPERKAKIRKAAKRNKQLEREIEQDKPLRKGSKASPAEVAKARKRLKARLAAQSPQGSSATQGKQSKGRNKKGKSSYGKSQVISQGPKLELYEHRLKNLRSANEKKGSIESDIARVNAKKDSKSKSASLKRLRKELGATQRRIESLGRGVREADIEGQMLRVTAAGEGFANFQMATPKGASSLLGKTIFVKFDRKTGEVSLPTNNSGQSLLPRKAEEQLQMFFQANRAAVEKFSEFASEKLPSSGRAQQPRAGRTTISRPEQSANPRPPQDTDKDQRRRILKNNETKSSLRSLIQKANSEHGLKIGVSGSKDQLVDRVMKLQEQGKMPKPSGEKTGKKSPEVREAERIKDAPFTPRKRATTFKGVSIDEEGDTPSPPWERVEIDGLSQSIAQQFTSTPKPLRRLSKGQKVSWRWSGGRATGVVRDVIPGKVTRSVMGTKVTRNGSEENPVVVIKSDRGPKNVLKLMSELQFVRNGGEDVSLDAINNDRKCKGGWKGEYPGGCYRGMEKGMASEADRKAAADRVRKARAKNRSKGALKPPKKNFNEMNMGELFAEADRIMDKPIYDEPPKKPTSRLRDSLNSGKGKSTGRLSDGLKSAMAKSDASLLKLQMTNLNHRSKSELSDIAKTHKVPGRSKMNKSQLAEAVRPFVFPDNKSEGKLTPRDIAKAKKRAQARVKPTSFKAGIQSIQEDINRLISGMEKRGKTATNEVKSFTRAPKVSDETQKLAKDLQKKISKLRGLSGRFDLERESRQEFNNKVTGKSTKKSERDVESAANAIRRIRRKRADSLNLDSEGILLSSLEKVGSQYRYRGQLWTLNKPKSAPPGSPKKMQVLASKNGKVKLLSFGARGYKHNYSPKAKANYLTRSAGIKDGSGNLTKDDKFSPNYWSRRVLWPKRETANG